MKIIIYTLFASILTACTTAQTQRYDSPIPVKVILPNPAST